MRGAACGDWRTHDTCGLHDALCDRTISGLRLAARISTSLVPNAVGSPPMSQVEEAVDRLDETAQEGTEKYRQLIDQNRNFCRALTSVIGQNFYGRVRSLGEWQYRESREPHEL